MQLNGKVTGSLAIGFVGALAIAFGSAFAGDETGNWQFLRLQPSSPGSVQAGNTNQSGISTAGGFKVRSPGGGVEFADGSVLTSAIGALGPQGPAGPAGPAGPEGPQGPAGSGAEFFSASGDGTMLDSNEQFASPTATVKIGASTDKLLVNASCSYVWPVTYVDFLQNSNEAYFYVAVRKVGESHFRTFGVTQSITLWARPDNSYKFDQKSVALTSVATGLDPGTYEVGLVGAAVDDFLYPIGSNVTVLKSE